MRLIEQDQLLLEGEQKRIQKAIAQRIYDLEKKTNGHSILFRALHVDLKTRFRVESYKHIKRHEMQTALRYIEKWIPRKVS